MDSPDPLRYLDAHRAYLLIASTRTEAFADEACRDVVDAFNDLRGCGLNQDMVSRVLSILQDETKLPSTRATEVAKLIGDVLKLARQRLS